MRLARVGDLMFVGGYRLKSILADLSLVTRQGDRGQYSKGALPCYRVYPAKCRPSLSNRNPLW
jgi:hypothetical protein